MAIAKRAAAGLAVFVVAIVLRAVGVSFGLDFDDPSQAIFDHEVDEETMVVAVRDSLLRGDFHPGRFLYWGSGGFYLYGAADAATLGAIALLSSHGFVEGRDRLAENPSLLFLVHRIVSLIAGGLTVVVVLRVLWRERGAIAAVAGAATLAAGYLHVRLSHFGTLDVLLTLFASLVLDRSLRLAATGRARHLLVAGALVGAATAVKYNGFLLAVPVGLAWLLSRRAPRAERPSFGALFAAGAAAIAVLVALSPHVFFAADDLMHHLGDLSRHRFQFTRVPAALAYHGVNSVWIGFGESATLLALAGAVLLLRDGRRGMTLLLLATSLVLFPVLIPQTAVRYGAPVQVTLALLAGCAVELVSRRTARPRAAAAILVAAAVLPSLARSASFDWLLTRPDTRTDVVRALRDAGARPTDVLAYGFLGLPGPSRTHAPPITQNYLQMVLQLEVLTPDDVRRSPPRFILLERSAIDLMQLPFGWSALEPIVSERYRPVLDLEPRRNGRDPVLFDRDAGQPSLLLPYGRPWQMTRPGPSLVLYERAEG